MLKTNKKLRENLKYITVAVDQACDRFRQQKKEQLMKPKTDPEVEKLLAKLKQRSEALRKL